MGVWGRMNRVQELIDERRDELPLGLAKTLLEACADQPRLYRVTVTRVTAVPYTEMVDDEMEAAVKMQTSTQMLILEAVEDGEVRCSMSLLDEGKLHAGWLKLQTPHTICHSDDRVLIVHSIEPFVPSRKRGRDT